MTYVDGFVIPIKKKNLKAYRKMAQFGAKLWKKYGALEYFECVGDDMNPKMGDIPIVTFLRLAKAKPGETVIFSFIVFKSKAHRNKVNAKVMKDPMMNDPTNKDQKMPFDMKRVAYGGFRTIVEV